MAEIDGGRQRGRGRGARGARCAGRQFGDVVAGDAPRPYRLRLRRGCSGAPIAAPESCGRAGLSQWTCLAAEDAAAGGRGIGLGRPRPAPPQAVTSARTAVHERLGDRARATGWKVFVEQPRERGLRAAPRDGLAHRSSCSSRSSRRPPRSRCCWRDGWSGRSSGCRSPRRRSAAARTQERIELDRARRARRPRADLQPDGGEPAGADHRPRVEGRGADPGPRDRRASTSRTSSRTCPTSSGRP